MVAEIFGIDGVVLLVVVAAVLFGSSRIPKLARSLGSAQAEFKRGQLHGDPDSPATPAVAPATSQPAAAPTATAAVSPNGSTAPASGPSTPVG